jgi:hypothetical protein
MVAVVALVVCAPGGFAAAAVITEPAGPFAVGGGPAAFRVVAQGFAPDANVFVEQCDGVPVSQAGWSPTIDCDLGSSPPPASADAIGVATFDGSKIFQPFQGESPQSLFNCLSAHQAAPANRLRSYTNCQIRVSTNNASATTDQTLIAIVLPPPGTPGPKVTTTTTSTGPRSTTAVTTPGGSRPLPGSKTTSTTNPKNRAPKGSRPGSDPRTAAAPASAAATSGGSRTLTGPGALVGYVLIAAGLVIALGAGIRSRRRRAA